MIGKVVRGRRVNGLIYYLFGPGECNEHINPHVVAGFRPPAALEPGVREDGARDARELNMLLNQPLRALPPGRGFDKPVWHCVLRAAPEDPVLSDDDWARIAHQVMDASGLAPAGDAGAVRWVAVRHAADHVHLVATLARQDGTRPGVWNDFYRVREACRRAEREYGLRSTAPADRTAAPRPTRAETERAVRRGAGEPSRVTLRRAVQFAAASSSEHGEFLDRLRADGVRVRLRYSRIDPSSITGYAVALPGDTNTAGDPVWFSGGKLAADLTWPKLCRRWTRPPEPRRQHEPRPVQRATLRATVARAAETASGQREFFSHLAEAGLRVRPRFSTRNPGEITGYAVATPGHTDPHGDPVWCSGGRLDPELSLPRLRHRWATRPPPITPGQRERAWREAAEAVGRAAGELHRCSARDPAGAADIAWATADVLTVTARVLGQGRDGELRRAVEAYDRAARQLHGRIPSPSRAGTRLRTVARALATTTSDGRRATVAAITLITRVAALSDAIAQLRDAQGRYAQAAAGYTAGDLCRTAAAATAERDRRSAAPTAHPATLGRRGTPTTPPAAPAHPEPAPTAVPRPATPTPGRSPRR